MKDTQIAIKGKGTLRFLSADEIVYIEANGHHAIIHTLTETIDVSCPLKELEASLGTQGVIRIHRSFMVSLDYIREIEDGQATLSDAAHTRLPIGWGYDEKLREEIKKRNCLFL